MGMFFFIGSLEHDANLAILPELFSCYYSSYISPGLGFRVWPHDVGARGASIPHSSILGLFLKPLSCCDVGGRGPKT